LSETNTIIDTPVDEDTPEYRKKTGLAAADAVAKETSVAARVPSGKHWYILKVQVNREDSIKRALERRVKIADLGAYFDDIIVPTEKVAEIRGRKTRTIQKKLYPGYIMVNMEINDDTWCLVRETSGIGDFTGSIGKPTPMSDAEIKTMLKQEQESPVEQPKLKVGYGVGANIKIKEGNFENFEGTVESIDLTSGKVVVIINLFGRSTPVELEYWQIEESAS
jgi:transcriptional antiterminator NusG